MKYQNIIFDFGNVIGTFDENYILRRFCCDEADFPLLSAAIFENWQALDEGIIDYDENIEHTVTLVPDRLKPTVRDFFANWYRHLTPLTQTWEFIRELKTRNYSVYLLSNASVKLANHADFYDIIKEFDGILFSAVVRKAKPEKAFYHCLFDTFRLKPEDCFFIDDKEENIATGKELGMDGIVFTGDIDAVKNAIEF